MSKPYIDFAAIKAAVSITQVLERYDVLPTLKPCGADSLRGNCPVHHGDNPKEFSVSIAKNCWHCFSSQCGGGGNVLDLVAKLEGSDVHGAALLLNEWFGLGLVKTKTGAKPTKPRLAKEPERDAPDPEANERVESQSAPASPEARPFNKPLGFELKDLDSNHPYLAERGLVEETVAFFGLGFCRNGTMAGRIVIPLHNAGGELVGYAGRWPGEPPEERPKYKLPKGFAKTAEVFNLHRLGLNEDMEPLVVVEGFFGCLWLWQHGFRNCVALMGSSMSEAQEEALVEHLASTEIPHVDLLFDEDDAGRKGRDDAMVRLGAHAYVRKISLGNEGRQPDSLSPDELASLIG